MLAFAFLTKKEHKKLPPLWDESRSHVLPPKFPVLFAKHRLCRSFDRPLTLDHAPALRQRLLVCTLGRGSSGTIFHPPPRPVLSSSGSLHWGCVCTYPFTGNHYTKNILKCSPLCQVGSSTTTTMSFDHVFNDSTFIPHHVPRPFFLSLAEPNQRLPDETDGILRYAWQPAVNL